MRVLGAATVIAIASATFSASADGVVTETYRKPIPNLPGKSLVSVTVTYAPGAGSKPHRHAKSGFAYVYVLAGQVRSQVDDEPVRIYRAGESFHENPGAHHRVSENASETEPAKLLAVFVVDSTETTLTTDDAQ